MADDSNSDLPTEVMDARTPTEAPVTKKTRAPRQPKTATAISVPEVVTSQASAAVDEKPAGLRRGRKPKLVDATVNAATTAKKADKATRVKRTAKADAPEAAAPKMAADEMEDLITLEEENKRLRGLLSDKLRSENADLRKRLGHN